ncbi:SprT-like domain-containing protein [Flexithrix dorotheae]|uniref:SprT-like domain-containing protein n=1 Tax=Flexithrix dorotheae TaxID=70993 RepID=UPI00038129A0|nr:SprT-like domain-containing protein [Flexithrix dorotheae]
MIKSQLVKLIKGKVPEQAVDILADWIIEYRIQVVITRERKTKRGSYYAPHNGRGHKITINHNLNQYSFLITFVHEVAHLLTWEQHKNRVAPHGKEWKRNFQELIYPMLNGGFFPNDIYDSLSEYMRNPGASSCSNPQLIKVLENYDENNGYTYLEDLPDNSIFRLEDGRVFKKLEKLRKNYRCKEITTGRLYYVSPIAKVVV